MNINDATSDQIQAFAFRSITPAGEFHIFKTRAEKRRWQRESGVVGDNNPLHRAQGRAAGPVGVLIPPSGGSSLRCSTENRREG